MVSASLGRYAAMIAVARGAGSSGASGSSGGSRARKHSLQIRVAVMPRAADQAPVQRGGQVEAEDVGDRRANEEREHDAADGGEQHLVAERPQADRGRAVVVAVVPERLEVALSHRLASRRVGVLQRGLGVALAGDRSPADAEVDDAGVEAEPVEGLDGVVGHLLQPDRAGAAVLVAQSEDQPAVVGRGDDLVAVQVAGQRLGGLGGDVARAPGRRRSCRRRARRRPAR